MGSWSCVRAALDFGLLGFRLESTAFPNPFQSEFTLQFAVTQSSEVSVVVHNSLGEPVANLLSKQAHEAGTYNLQIDGSELATGIYFVTITMDDQAETIRMVKTD